MASNLLKTIPVNGETWRTPFRKIEVSCTKLLPRNAHFIDFSKVSRLNLVANESL